MSKKHKHVRQEAAESEQPVVINDLGGLAEAMPELKHDLSPIVESLARQFEGVIVPFEQASELKAEARTLMAKAKEIMSDPVFEQANQMAEQNRGAVQAIEATAHALDIQARQDPQIKNMIAIMFKAGKQKEFFATLKAQNRLQAEQICHEQQQEHLRLAAALAELDKVLAAKRQEADALGDKARALFGEAEKVLVGAGLVVEAQGASN
jgi:hypothetical protein